GLADLLNAAALGRHIPTMTFSAVIERGEGEFEFQTITLTDVVIAGYEEKAGFATRVALAYDLIEVALTEQNPDRSVGQVHRFSSRDRADGAGLAPLPAGALDPVVPVDTAAKYFLQVDGIEGGSTDQQHVGAFVVASYEFDVAAMLASSGGGGAAGPTTFSPLIVDLAATPGLADLLSAAALGPHSPTMTVSAADERGGGAIPVQRATPQPAGVHH